MTKIRTSDSHPLYIDSMKVPGTAGLLGMTICPGKKGPSEFGFVWDRDLQEDLRTIKNWGASSVVTLMEEGELAMLDVPRLGERIRGYQMQWYFCPIVDLHAPAEAFEIAWEKVAPGIRRKLAAGEKIVVHCRGGLGRTGTIVARLLIDFGLDTHQVITQVRCVRPGAIQTSEQEQYLLNYHPDGRRGLAYFQGCLLGGAIGDALGGAVEFDCLDTILNKYGNPGISAFDTAFGRIGAITDDTQMTLFTAEGILRAEHRSRLKGIDPVFAQVTHRSYLRWLVTQGDDDHFGALDNEWFGRLPELYQRRSPGSTCLSALRTGEMGTLKRPINNSKGCGGVMRVAPAGLFMQSDAESFHPEERLQWAFKIGCDLAAITHGHSSGYLAAGIFAQLIADIIGGTSLDAALDRVDSSLRHKTRARECLTLLRKARDLANRPATDHPGRLIKKTLGEGWVADEALAIAVYAVLAHPGHFDKAIVTAVNHDGDSDSTGSIAGNLSGALLGLSSISHRWLDQLEMREVIQQVATDLYVGFSSRNTWWEKYPGY